MPMSATIELQNLFTELNEIGHVDFNGWQRTTEFMHYCVWYRAIFVKVSLADKKREIYRVSL